MHEVLEQAKKHKSYAAILTYEEKRRALLAMAEALVLNKEEILSENTCHTKR